MYHNLAFYKLILILDCKQAQSYSPPLETFRVYFSDWWIIYMVGRICALIPFAKTKQKMIIFGIKWPPYEESGSVSAVKWLQRAHVHDSCCNAPAEPSHLRDGTGEGALAEQMHMRYWHGRIICGAFQRRVLAYKQQRRWSPSQLSTFNFQFIRQNGFLNAQPSSFAERQMKFRVHVSEDVSRFFLFYLYQAKGAFRTDIKPGGEIIEVAKQINWQMYLMVLALGRERLLATSPTHIISLHHVIQLYQG